MANRKRPIVLRCPVTAEERAMICLKRELTMPIKAGIISIQAVFALSINHSGVIGILPGLSACICTWFLDTVLRRRLVQI